MSQYVSFQSFCIYSTSFLNVHSHGVIAAENNEEALELICAANSNTSDCNWFLWNSLKHKKHKKKEKNTRHILYVKWDTNKQNERRMRHKLKHLIITKSNIYLIMNKGWTNINWYNVCFYIEGYNKQCMQYDAIINNNNINY